MPVTVTYNPKGDLFKEKTLRDYALSQKVILRDLMKFNGLKQDQRRIDMIDGSVITIKSCFDDDRIDIYSPKPEKKYSFGYERFFALSTIGVWRQALLVGDACTIWDLHNDRLATVNFSLPAPWVGETDAAQWANQHFDTVGLSAGNYTIGESQNTITCNLMDFTALNSYGPCVKSGDFVYFWPGRRYTRVHAVEPHVLHVGNVTNLFYNGYYPNIEVACNIRMFLEFPPGIHAMNGCGGGEYQNQNVGSASPMTTGDRSYCNDSFQMQSHSGYGNIVMAQCNKLDKSSKGFFTSYNYNTSSGFEAAFMDMVNLAYSRAGADGVDQPGYTASNMYRFNEIAGDT